MRQPVPLDISSLPVGDNPALSGEYPKGSQFNNEQNPYQQPQNFQNMSNPGNINQNLNEIVPFPRLCMNNPNDNICFPLVIKPKRIGKTPITYIYRRKMIFCA